MVEWSLGEDGSAAPSFLVVRTQRFSKHRPMKSLAFSPHEGKQIERHAATPKDTGSPAARVGLPPHGFGGRSKLTRSDPVGRFSLTPHIRDKSQHEQITENYGGRRKLPHLSFETIKRSKKGASQQEHTRKSCGKKHACTSVDRQKKAPLPPLNVQDCWKTSLSVATQLVVSTTSCDKGAAGFE